ncbi:MAG: hypothetical protein LIP02_07145 [Bacteroidales bacterium]|nr:hypothetical protein [Bacteroidales bacterium]
MKKISFLLVALALGAFTEAQATRDWLNDGELSECGSITCDDNTVWSAWYTNGLVSVDKATMEVKRYDPEELGVGSSCISDVAVDPTDGSLWLTSRSANFYNLKDGQMKVLQYPNAETRHNFHSRFSPEGDYWAFSLSIIGTFKDDVWQPLDYSDSPIARTSNYGFRNLAWDSNGDIWMTSSEPYYAVLHFTDGVVAGTYGTGEWLVDNISYTIYATAMSPDDKILLTTNENILVFDTKTEQFTEYPYYTSEKDFAMTCVTYDSKGLAWLAGKGMVSTFDGEKNEVVAVEGLGEDEEVIAICADGEDIWLATDNANIFLLSEGTVRKVAAGVEDTLIDTTVTPADSRIYNLQGQLVTNPVKGSLYIQDGKKVIW